MTHSRRELECSALSQKRELARQQSGNSSVGRAPPCQGGSREFESRFPLQLPFRCFFKLTLRRRAFAVTKRNETAVADLVREYAFKATPPSERCSSVFPAPIPPSFDQRMFLRRRCCVGTSGNETAVADLVVKCRAVESIFCLGFGSSCDSILKNKRMLGGRRNTCRPPLAFHWHSSRIPRRIGLKCQALSAFFLASASSELWHRVHGQ